MRFWQSPNAPSPQTYQFGLCEGLLSSPSIIVFGNLLRVLACERFNYVAFHQLQGFSLINVSDAEGADSGNGHGYFRSSPWASSDVLMTLYYGLLPGERGLVKDPDLPVFSFPPDYLERTWAAIEARSPEFAAKYEAYKKAQAGISAQ